MRSMRTPLQRVPSQTSSAFSVSTEAHRRPPAMPRLGAALSTPPHAGFTKVGKTERYPRRHNRLAAVRGRAWGGCP